MWYSFQRSPDYEVSRDGEVRNKKTKKVLVPSDNGFGILKVNLIIEGERVTVAVARLIAEAFLPEPNDGDVIFYKDGNSHNVCAENLQWRPRWFAQEWARQQKAEKPLRNRKIRVRPRDSNSDEDWVTYNNSLECALATYAIEKYIVLACGREDYYYNRSVYEWIWE